MKMSYNNDDVFVDWLNWNARWRQLDRLNEDVNHELTNNNITNEVTNRFKTSWKIESEQQIKKK